MCCGQSRWLSWFSAPTITINTLMHVKYTILQNTNITNITKSKYYTWTNITDGQSRWLSWFSGRWITDIMWITDTMAPLLNQPLPWWWRMRAVKSRHQFLIEPNNGYDGHYCHWGIESIYIDGAWRCIDDNRSSGFDEHADSVDDFHFHPANVIAMISTDLMIPRGLFSQVGRPANQWTGFDDDDFHRWV